MSGYLNRPHRALSEAMADYGHNSRGNERARVDALMIRLALPNVPTIQINALVNSALRPAE